MSDAYLRRLVIATHDLAAHDDSIRTLLGKVDWGRCETPEETDYETLSCLQQNEPLRADDADPLAPKPICTSCEENCELLRQVRTERGKRYLAMRRVVRLSKHVGHQ